MEAFRWLGVKRGARPGIVEVYRSPMLFHGLSITFRMLEFISGLVILQT
jgi:hypothetical protein